MTALERAEALPLAPALLARETTLLVTQALFCLHPEIWSVIMAVGRVVPALVQHPFTLS